MATYPVKNTVTGETKEVVMSIHDWDQWKLDNPEWIRDFSDPSTCPGVGEVGEWKDKLRKKAPGWNDVLRRAQKNWKQPSKTYPRLIPMPRKRKSSEPIGVGMTAKQMRRKKPINTDFLVDITPLTDNQETLFKNYHLGKNIFAYGAAGTGKTFIVLYNALKDVLDENSPYQKIYIVRSLVSTREIGFLPGDHEDKSALYQIPYKNMVKYMFELPTDSDFEMLYGNLKQQETISFWSTSFIRGTTLDDAIIIVDECQNLNFHELDSIITRVGENTKIHFCGDATQTDLTKTYERNGILDFMKILEQMPSFSSIEFDVNDIVRSGLCKEYLTTKLALGM